MFQRSPVIIAAMLFCLAFAPQLARAEDHATPDEAKSMVERAIVLIKQVGPEKAFAAIDDKTNKEFHDRDLYVYVRTFDGNTVAHGANVGLIGHTNLDFKDADGKAYIKEMVDDAKAGKDTGWIDYRFPNPQSHKIEQKSSYYERSGDYLVCAGVYKG